MRLLLLSSEFPPGPGGIGTHAYQLANHMAQFNWRVHVLTLQDYASSEEIENFNRLQKFEISHLQRTNNRIQDLWTRFQSLVAIIKKWKPDLLVVTGDRQVWLVAIVQFIIKISIRRYQLIYCAIWHGMTPPTFLARQITAWAFGQADAVVSVSQYSLEQLVAIGTKLHRQMVIPNGADHKLYFPDAAGGQEIRTKLGMGGVKILLTVGHVSERKGQDIVIRALPEILRSVPDVHYLIVGLPTMQKTLEILASELGVDSHLHFAGHVGEKMLSSAYNVCDIFILTSRHSSNGEFEGYGIVVVESALCAKPAVVAGNSGLAEAVQDGRTGFVVPENDPRAVAQAVIRLLLDDELRKQMGDFARNRALMEQTWSICMNRYDQIFRDLTGK